MEIWSHPQCSFTLTLYCVSGSSIETIYSVDVILQDRKGGYLWGISAFPDAKPGSFPQEARDMCAKGWDNLIIPTYAGKWTNKIFGLIC